MQIFGVTVLEQTVDDVLGVFNKAVASLVNIAERETDKASDFYADAADAKKKAITAENESARARKIAASINALIAG